MRYLLIIIMIEAINRTTITEAYTIARTNNNALFPTNIPMIETTSNAILKNSNVELITISPVAYTSP